LLRTIGKSFHHGSSAGFADKATVRSNLVPTTKGPAKMSKINIFELSIFYNSVQPAELVPSVEEAQAENRVAKHSKVMAWFRRYFA
jgi:hypothetical protein